MGIIPSRNLEEQRREENGVTYFDRGVVEGKDGRKYRRLAIQTHFVQRGEDQAAFLKWLYEFEYDRLALPQPDLVIYLDVPTDFTEKLLRHRESDTHTKADIHEQDTAYLATCRESGRAAAQFYGWTVIQCVKDGQMRTIEDIHEEIYRHVAACLEE